MKKRWNIKFIIGKGSSAGFPNSLRYHYLNQTRKGYRIILVDFYFKAYFYMLYLFPKRPQKYFIQVGKIGVFSRPWFLMKMAPVYHHWLDLINLDLGQGQLWHRSPWNTFEMNLCIVKHETFFMHHPVFSLKRLYSNSSKLIIIKCHSWPFHNIFYLHPAKTSNNFFVWR